MNTVTRN